MALLAFVFGVGAVALFISGFILGVVYFIRGSPSKAYRILAISFGLGVLSGGIAIALALRGLWILLYTVAVALFIALPPWLMRHFVNLPIQKQVKFTLYLIAGMFLLMVLGWLLYR